VGLRLACACVSLIAYTQAGGRFASPPGERSATMTAGGFPDVFRYIFIALAAMVAYRFVSELADSSSAEVSQSPRNATATAEGFQGPAADVPAAKNNSPEASPAKRQHNLKRNQVLIEYCTG